MIGIMGAMTEEISALVDAMEPGGRSVRAGLRDYHVGRLWGHDVAVVFSRWGKVAAATTATHLIAEFGAASILFTGVAGAANPGLRIGDIVVAGDVYQHDMDARPIFPRHEIPLLGITAIETDAVLRERLLVAAQRFIAEQLTADVRPDAVQRFNLARPAVVIGGVASGDKFFASSDDIVKLHARLPVECVEMEGAAVAQVCYEHGVPFAMVRTISDTADETAHIDFMAFVKEVASVYSRGILRMMLV
ncbi:MAG TPA: 5'-methylthioadenosine/adenosylhomocysteine nucleosidase [Candidatus Kapabacteria bacterium]|nr:5'-methylthioadenosine/adenosylhomocysteine nucleosidase [Candidatus Kapabacteria bacterium]